MDRRGALALAVLGACSSSSSPDRAAPPEVPAASIVADQEHGGLVAHVVMRSKVRPDQSVTIGGQLVTDDEIDLGEVLLGQAITSSGPLRFPQTLIVDPSGGATTIDLAGIVTSAMRAVERAPIPGGEDDPDRGDGVIWLDESSGDGEFLGTAAHLAEVDWVATVRETPCAVGTSRYVRLFDRRTGEELLDQELPCSATSQVVDWLRGELAAHRLRRPAAGLSSTNLVGEPATAPASGTFALPPGKGTGWAWMEVGEHLRSYLAIEVEGAPLGTSIGIGGVTVTAGIDGRVILDVDATSLLGGMSPLAEPAHAAVLVPVDVDGVTTNVAVRVQAQWLDEQLGRVPVRFGDADVAGARDGLLWIRQDHSRFVVGSAARLIDIDLIVIEGGTTTMSYQNGRSTVTKTFDLSVMDRRTGEQVATKSFGDDEAAMRAWLTKQLAR